MKRWLPIVVLAWVVFVGLPSIPAVRGVLASPLVVTDPDARGDACYVLAGGHAFTERLAAASDLYNMHRVPRIIIQRADELGPYNFVAKASWTATEWALDFLTHSGVPRDKILVIAEARGMFGTLAEARNVKASLPADVRTLVIVSSAPHMRRSMLAFSRVHPAGVTLHPYAATDFSSGDEYFRPIWLEYLKLAVYELVAWRRNGRERSGLPASCRARGTIGTWLALTAEASNGREARVAPELGPSIVAVVQSADSCRPIPSTTPCSCGRS